MSQPTNSYCQVLFKTLLDYQRDQPKLYLWLLMTSEHCDKYADLTARRLAYKTILFPDGQPNYQHIDDQLASRLVRYYLYPDRQALIRALDWPERVQVQVDDWLSKIGVYQK